MEEWLKHLGLDQVGDLIIRLNVEIQEEGMYGEDDLYYDFLHKVRQHVMDSIALRGRK